MKILVVAVAAASLVAGTVLEVNAASYSRAYKSRYPDNGSGWHPHDSNQLSFGSTD